ncbi:UNVERIFIED_CONTAM: hypothetical protein K2H54_006109 [Gekko kuhli]
MRQEEPGSALLLAGSRKLDARLERALDCDLVGLFKRMGSVVPSGLERLLFRCLVFPLLEPLVASRLPGKRGGVAQRAAAVLWLRRQGDRAQALHNGNPCPQFGTAAI